MSESKSAHLPSTDTQRSEFDSILRVLRRRRWVIVLCLLLVTSAALAFSLMQEKQYSATASLLFRDPALDQKLFGSSPLPPSSDPAREAATNVQLVSLETVADRTARKLGGPLTGDEIKNRINVAAAGTSDVVSITATDPDPRFAAKLANLFALDYIAFRRDADRSKVTQARKLVQRQLDKLPVRARDSARGRSLEHQAEDLQILASLQTGNAELVQPADVPQSPSSPKTVRTTIAAALFGLLLGLGLAFLFERLDRGIKDLDEIEEAYGLSLLAAIPETRRLAEEGRLSPAAAESFRMLRARLRYFNVDRDIRSILVTSSAPQEGKTTVSWHLAATAAAGGARVLLVETDLRRPTLAQTYDLRMMPGLAEQLSRGAPLEDVIQRAPLDSASGPNDPARALKVIVAGAVPPNPAELLESDRMAEVLRDLVARYDLVVLDTSPMSVVADGMALVNQVSGVVVVGRVGKTTRQAARHLVEQLRNLGAPLLGVVGNRVRFRAPVYYGEYGYSIDQASGANGKAAAPDMNGDGGRRRGAAVR